MLSGGLLERFDLRNKIHRQNGKPKSEGWNKVNPGSFVRDGGCNIVRYRKRGMISYWTAIVPCLQESRAWRFLDADNGETATFHAADDAMQAVEAYLERYHQFMAQFSVLKLDRIDMTIGTLHVTGGYMTA